MEGHKQPQKTGNVRVVNRFLSGSVIKFGLTFVMGVLVGFMIFSIGMADRNDGPSSTDQMKGTFYDSRTSGNMKTADVLQYDSPVAKAAFNVKYSAQIIEIAVDLSSEGPVRCTVQFDYNNFEVLGVRNVSVNGETTATAAGNFVQINNSGENRLLVYLQNKTNMPNNIDFKIFQNDSPVFQNSVQVNKE